MCLKFDTSYTLKRLRSANSLESVFMLEPKGLVSFLAVTVCVFLVLSCFGRFYCLFFNFFVKQVGVSLTCVERWAEIFAEANVFLAAFYAQFV